MQPGPWCSECQATRFFPLVPHCNMDYRQKMVVPPQQNIKTEEDDDEDLEALRLAALKSLKPKDTTHTRRQPIQQLQKVVPQIIQISRPPYKGQRVPRRGYFHNRPQQRQNGNLYYQSPRNPNLIAIVPVDEQPTPPQANITCPVKSEKTELNTDTQTTEVTKFHRFKDHGSGSEEEDNKDSNNIIPISNIKVEEECIKEEESVMEKEDETEPENNLEGKEEDKDESNDDDDDILLMADLEEEDSLERLMDEMEKEMSVDKPSEKKDKKSSRKENKESIKIGESKVVEHKNRTEESNNSSSRKDTYSPAPHSSTVSKSERRSISPHTTSRISQKRRSLSPRPRLRKKSPRRSPRRSPRSPIRQLKKSQRELTRYRSPRRSPSRYSPRSRSPKLSPRPRSPRLSPNDRRSPMRRSPLRKLSPRGRSPKLSPHPRSPRPRRSRSPRIITRSKSPRLPRSPRPARSRSPRFSPRMSPQSRSPLRSKSPRLSPRRSPLRRSPKLRSPGLSPRRGSPRMKSPKVSPRRNSPRPRSPRASPRRSPWSSPRNSPRLSPKRRRSPKWSPKEPPKKHIQRSLTPEKSNSPLYIREPSPATKSRVSPEPNRGKTKREDHSEKVISIEKESTEIINDPVLEARRRKFECTKPIDPINVNKKIKLSRKENTSKKETVEECESMVVSVRKPTKVVEDFEVQDVDLNLEPEYEFEDFEDTVENTSPITIASSVASSMEIDLPKPEKERSSKKKKKKRDKELYQAGKVKSELPLSERIGKDKKCKKRKDPSSDGTSEDVETILEDMTVDEEGDLRTELSRRRAERLNRAVPVQSARLVQSAFKGVVNEVVKSNAKVNQRHVIKTDEKPNQKEIRRVTVLHRTVPDVHDSEDESTIDSKVPVRFRLGVNKLIQDAREPKVSRKASKRQGRKVKHKSNLTLPDPEHVL